jgi:hypothetical protein
VKPALAAERRTPGAASAGFTRASAQLQSHDLERKLALGGRRRDQLGNRTAPGMNPMVDVGDDQLVLMLRHSAKQQVEQRE